MAAEETTQSLKNLNSSSKNDSRLISQEGDYNSDEDETETPRFMIVVRSLAIVFGVVGFVMNGLVLRAFPSKKRTHDSTHTFLKNQIIMDTLSSFLLIVVYAYKLAVVDFYYEGSGGFALCILFNSDVLLYTIQVGSIASLVLIAAERYLKIVLPILHTRFYKDWMTIVAITFAWLNGILMNICMLWTSRLVSGKCLVLRFWPTPASGAMYGIFLVSWQFVIPLLLFGCFYGGILYVVLKRSRVFQGNYEDEMAATLQKSARRSQMNAITTMFAVSASFVVSWFPNQAYAILCQVGVVPIDDNFYHSSTLFIFLNTCVNPFIIASKHELVRRNLSRMFAKKPLNKTLVLATVT